MKDNVGMNVIYLHGYGKMIFMGEIFCGIGMNQNIIYHKSCYNVTHI